MMAGGISQIIEQILRVVTAVGLVLLVASWGLGDRKIAAVATFGSVLGSIGAFGVMLYYAKKLKRQDLTDPALSIKADDSSHIEAAVSFDIQRVVCDIRSNRYCSDDRSVRI